MDYKKLWLELIDKLNNEGTLFSNFTTEQRSELIYIMEQAELKMARKEDKDEN